MAKKITLEAGKLLLDQAIETHKHSKGALMPVLHEAQHIFGAVSLEIQRYISVKMHIPVSDIYGVVTFYSQFTMVPNGDYLVSVCMGTACYVKNAQSILEGASRNLNLPVKTTSSDGKFTLMDTRCIGACGLAPVMTINDDVYGRLTESEIPGILEKYTDS